MAGIRVDEQRQGIHRLREVADVHEPAAEGREQQWRGLAGGARNRKHDPRQDARQSGPHHDRQDGPPGRDPECQRGFPERPWHEAQDLLGGPHDDRRHDDRQGDAPGEGVVLLERQHEEREHEDPDEDRRHADQDVRGETDGASRASRTGFIDEDPCEHPDGDGDQGREGDHLDRPEDRRGRPATDALGPGRLRQQIEVECREPIDRDEDQDHGERDDAGDRGSRRNRSHDPVGQGTSPRRTRPGEAGGAGGAHRFGHQVVPSGPATRHTSSRATMFMTMVITSRTSPRAIRLEVWRPTDASLNVVAILDAMVWA